MNMKLYSLNACDCVYCLESPECSNGIGNHADAIKYRLSTEPPVSVNPYLSCLLPQITDACRSKTGINTLRLRRNRRHFSDAIFKCIVLNANVLNSIKISLKFIPKSPINNIPALVQIMAWRRPGDKPLSVPMMVSLWRIYASLGLNELSAQKWNRKQANQMARQKSVQCPHRPKKPRKGGHRRRYYKNKYNRIEASVIFSINMKELFLLVITLKRRRNSYDWFQKKIS